MIDQDTIVAQATPVGRGGVGVIRLSGPLALSITKNMVHLFTAKAPVPRKVHRADFLGSTGAILDQGLLIFFPAPHSFTGEDVVEFHAHGGVVVLDLLVKRAIELGARSARPGEFSERAFLNGKIDLSQAEAIADLIDSCSAQAARCAVRSLQGAFSQRIHSLVSQLIKIRTYVEASIDFAEEDIELLQAGQIQTEIGDLLKALEQIKISAEQGARLSEGVRVALAGKPNAGKSSLLNRLAGLDRAIVTELPGTTRDTLHESLIIEGFPFIVTDTAGLRETEDLVEKQGVLRAYEAVEQSDLVLVMMDASARIDSFKEHIQALGLAHIEQSRVLVVQNKIDLLGMAPESESTEGYDSVKLSAKTGAGMDLLIQTLLRKSGVKAGIEGQFSARRRHLDALDRTEIFLRRALEQIQLPAIELLAEDLKQAQICLGEITGEVTSDDLLGEIFASFCIGK